LESSDEWNIHSILGESSCTYDIQEELTFIEVRDLRLYDFLIKFAGLHEKMNKEPLFVLTHTDKV
jgi:hypothetical protein